PNFDIVLDDALGYYNVDDDENFATSFAEMAPGSNYQDTGDSSSTSAKRSLMVLEKRWGFRSVFRAVSSAVVSTVRTVVRTVVPAVVNVVQQAARTVVQVATTIVNTPFSPSVRFNVPVNAVARANQNSPFGPAFQIYRYRVPDDDPAKRGFQQRLDGILDQLLPDPGGPPAPGVVFYCVDCGVTGNVAVAGSVSFTLLNGINAGNVAISGNLRAGIQIGLDAYAELRKEITLARLVGPEVTLDLKADFAISAQGQLLAGYFLPSNTATLQRVCADFCIRIIATWPAFNANLDFVNPSRSTQSGFTPRIERVFNARGTLTASSSLGLPLGLAFGFDLLNGRYAKSIALINTPAIGAEASFTAAFKADSGSSIGDGTCPGVAWSIGLSNDVELNVLDLRIYPLFTWDSPPLADGCVTSSSRSSTSSSSSLRPVSTTSAAIPAPTPLTCPASELQYDITRFGTRFRLRCYQDIPGYDLTTAVRLLSIAGCIEKCKDVPNCQAITWVPSRVLSCYFKPANAPFVQQAFECDSAYVVTARTISNKRDSAAFTTPHPTPSSPAATSPTSPLSPTLQPTTPPPPTPFPTSPPTPPTSPPFPPMILPTTMITTPPPFPNPCP
ncbi:MAG: hypothetical protein Q9183_005170, partial [Haloplaca sp. 2 TL-2023]